MRVANGLPSLTAHCDMSRYGKDWKRNISVSVGRGTRSTTTGTFRGLKDLLAVTLVPVFFL